MAGKKNGSPNKFGQCALTLKEGKYVDSHIIPKALTKADGLAPGLTQYQFGKIEKRFSSWYDPALVIREGEDILSAYDSWGIKKLRELRLVWSGWGHQTEIIDQHKIHDKFGIRLISGHDWKNLRVFFLSILWRAAASKRVEFKEITIPNNELELLRKMVVDGNPESLFFYPITLTQISTRGLNHNHGPIADRMKIPSLKETGKPWFMPYFRFYMDGLIVNFSRLSEEKNKYLNLGSQWVGSDKENLLISTVSWDISSQKLNMDITLSEAFLGRPLYEIRSGPFGKYK
jgi:hypothetical protein